ncbi:hypothetical protein LK09_01150 [Microbacterium mangrovi]|uniref:Uncharacterized protein n=1 Tax=Microbacterium mangrovi TaxID=1348253 RepID=A0A0B2A9V7_9MICO|nr:hypothetical protein [Microbacterium mangrovi]KHK99954.1 hypothetical protein LK09_01150 [Microbacterium mangrovi]
MAWGKTEEQKQAERLQQEAAARDAAAQQKARDEAARQKAFLASPLGRAHTAFDRGDGFFQFQAVTSQLTGEPSGFGSSGNAVRSHDDHVQLLAQVEAVGWRLENVGYTFVPTGSTSTARMLSTGEGTVNEGYVSAVYLFRRAT